ncbi:ATP-binding protein [Streptomyces axinellae]|uniref:histidine kinase n=1 Tax=Streptomyces axinellae TaxID=552788 RepID=A0ABN3QXY0_9ACTN
MTEIPVALTVILSVGTAAAVALALLLARSRAEAKRLRKRSSALESDLQSAAAHQAALTARVQGTEAEVRHLAGARLPDLTAALAHPNVPVRGPLDPAVAGSELDRALTAVLDQVGDAVTKERLRVDGAAQAAMRGATTTIQALLYQLQTRLQTMQERYDDPGVAEDLLAADFLNEQALRRIQSTAVVCGAWPGLTRENSHLSDIVVGAMSRLTGYERVQIANQLRDPVGVVARAVEPVAVVLTELIGNALHYSHPDLPVPVTLQQGNRGASVIIDDAGVGMHSDELAHARHMMAGPDTVLLTELGDPPRTGLAAVGQLVRQYGFTTHVEASPYGGVRAIVHIPGDPLLTLLDEAEQPMSAMAPLPPTTPPLPGRSSTQHAPIPAAHPEPALGGGAGSGWDALPATGSAMTEDADSELPRRRRRRPEAGAAQPGRHAAPEASGASGRGFGPEMSVPEPSPEQSAERWAAFQRGTTSGRAAAEGPASGDTAADHLADPHSAEGNPHA